MIFMKNRKLLLIFEKYLNILQIYGLVRNYRIFCRRVIYLFIDFGNSEHILMFP